MNKVSTGGSAAVKSMSNGLRTGTKGNVPAAIGPSKKEENCNHCLYELPGRTQINTLATMDGGREGWHMILTGNCLHEQNAKRPEKRGKSVPRKYYEYFEITRSVMLSGGELSYGTMISPAPFARRTITARMMSWANGGVTSYSFVLQVSDVECMTNEGLVVIAQAIGQQSKCLSKVCSVETSQRSLKLEVKFETPSKGKKEPNLSQHNFRQEGKLGS